MYKEPTRYYNIQPSAASKYRYDIKMFDNNVNKVKAHVIYIIIHHNIVIAALELNLACGMLYFGGAIFYWKIFCRNIFSRNHIYLELYLENMFPT